MANPLPSEQEYLCNEVLRRHERGRQESMNRRHGDHVEDVSNWNGKLTADPSAGTGEGAPCQAIKPEII